MHTTRGPNGTIFHHNGDFSGEVIITERDFTREVEIPFADLKALVAVYVRQARHQAIDAMNDEDLLRAWAIR